MKLESSNYLLQRQQNANDQVVFEYEEQQREEFTEAKHHYE